VFEGVQESGFELELEQPGGRPYHVNVFPPVPPPTETEIDVGSRASTGLGVAVGGEMLSTEFTVSRSDPETVFPFESVTATLTVNGLPDAEVGTHGNDAEPPPGSVHPGGTEPDHEYV
jgi:hypothetical protein